MLAKMSKDGKRCPISLAAPVMPAPAPVIPVESTRSQPRKESLEPRNVSERILSFGRIVEFRLLEPAKVCFFEFCWLCIFRRAIM